MNKVLGGWLENSGRSIDGAADQEFSMRGLKVSMVKLRTAMWMLVFGHRQLPYHRAAGLGGHAAGALDLLM